MARKKFDTKRARFKSLAEDRTNAIINRIRILSHCSNKALYDYEATEIEKIFNAIEDAIGEAKSKFKDTKKDKFRL